MLATVAKMARPLFKGSFKSSAVIAPVIAVATFAAIGILHWPLPTACIALFMRLHPLWAFAAAALLGLAGLI